MMSDLKHTDDVIWSSPVRVRIGYGFPEPVRGPREALEYLKWRWPVRHGLHYFEALKQCAAGLQNAMPLEKVRETFVLASIEAKMLG